MLINDGHPKYKKPSNCKMGNGYKNSRFINFVIYIKKGSYLSLH